MSVAALPARVRTGDLAAVALLAVAFAVGVAAYGAVPERVVVHWTFGAGPYWGLRTLPKALGLFLVPLVATVLYVAMRAPLALLPAEELGAVRGLYEAVVVGTVGLCCAVQLFVVAMNLT